MKRRLLLLSAMTLAGLLLIEACSDVAQSVPPERSTTSSSTLQASVASTRSGPAADDLSTPMTATAVVPSSATSAAFAAASSTILDDRAFAGTILHNRSSTYATYRGCNVFAQGGYYNLNVSHAPIDAHSAEYLASVTATDNTGFYGSTGIEPINVATVHTARYTVKPTVSYHSFPVPYPWSGSFQIESRSDAHLIVVLGALQSCHLYEAYNAAFSGNVLSAYSGADWDLSRPYRVVPSSAMASGLSLFAGSVKHEEIATGIHHALNLSVFSGALCNCFTPPASGTDGYPHGGPNTAYELPYGAQLRLKASYDDSQFGVQAKAIAEGMKHYGVYVADTGAHAPNNNALYLGNPTDGGTWDQFDLDVLGNLRLTDFEVLKVGSITNR